MRKYNSLQMELFSSADNKMKSSVISRSPLDYIWNHEKIILIIIGFLIVGIVSFSLGVKKGRQLSIAKEDKELKGKPQIIKKEEVKTEKEVIGPSLEKADANYTILVATYLTRTYAQREAEKLKQKGLQTLVLPKGKYIELCVGKFINKDEAKVILKELKNKFHDCYIKKL